MEQYQTPRGTLFQYNIDFNGDVVITDGAGNQCVIPAEDILELVAWGYVARQKISRVEQFTTDELLLGTELATKKKKMESR